MEDDITVAVNTVNSPLIFDTMDTITIGHSSSDLTTTWTEPNINFGSILGKRNKPDPNETVISYKVSPLAVILQLRDNGTENWQIMDSMLGVSVESLDVSEDNIRLADEIKEYYRAKIITDTLSSKRVRTEYRSSLMMALALLDMCQTKQSFIPMLIKLHDFYREDTAMENLTSTYLSLSEEESNKLVTDKTIVLRLVDQVTVNKRTLKSQNFFFADANNHLYVLNTEIKNPLIPFLNVLANGKELTLRCRIKPTNMRFYNFYFYSILDKFEVLEIK